MIIYTRDIDYSNIDALVATPERLVTYVKRTVPMWCKCIPGIEDNQRFYTALQVRTLLHIPFKTRRAAMAALCDGIKLTGLTTACITLQEVLDACDSASLRALVERQYEQCNYG